MTKPKATAFLLAAGLGTRLRPYTLVRPKALLPVCGIPMLDYALALVRQHGHEHVIVNAHHLWQQVAGWADCHGVELQVELPGILGTGGGLRAALERLAPRVTIVNADILCDVDLSALAAAVPADGASMALRQMSDGETIGLVQADGQGRVRRITSVVDVGGGTGATHFTGIHAMSESAIARIPPEGEQGVIETAYKALVVEGRVGSLVHTGTWVDIGTPETYLQANLDVLHGRVHVPLDPWSRGRRVGDNWVGEGARIEGQATGSIVGDGAIVPPDSSLRDCVVWDGAVVPAGVHERKVFLGANDVAGPM